MKVQHNDAAAAPRLDQVSHHSDVGGLRDDCLVKQQRNSAGTYCPPNFEKLTYSTTDGLRALANSPDAQFSPSPRDGCLPGGFFSSTNRPTYFKVAGTWQLAREPRMDAVAVIHGGVVSIREMRAIRMGDLVAVGLAEDGSQGIYVHDDGFSSRASNSLGGFHFMGSDVSREKPTSYELIADRLERERALKGNVIWVVGPAVVHTGARDELEWLIEHGYVHSFFSGNAVAVHDIEADLFKTSLGMSADGNPTPDGHGLHLRAINIIRQVGSIEDAVERGVIRGGIMHALVRCRIPYVLAGSIRDDGPLPGVETDSVRAQDAMRQLTIGATGTVMLASALHGIATGNMLPTYFERKQRLEELLVVCVDQEEFVVNKLKDRGTQQAYGVVSNAQDFLKILVFMLRQKPRSGDSSEQDNERPFRGEIRESDPLKPTSSAASCLPWQEHVTQAPTCGMCQSTGDVFNRPNAPR